MHNPDVETDFIENNAEYKDWMESEFIVLTDAELQEKIKEHDSCKRRGSVAV